MTINYSSKILDTLITEYECKFEEINFEIKCEIREENENGLSYGQCDWLLIRHHDYIRRNAEELEKLCVNPKFKQFAELLSGSKIL
eukprot:244662_1